MNDRKYHISDVVNEEYLRFPLGLLAEPKYRFMSLEAKMIYSLLLNRLTLSQKNGWINDSGEVYLIYTREIPVLYPQGAFSLVRQRGETFELKCGNYNK